MHIPDGYLGPQTYGTLYAAVIPIWVAASRILKRTLKQREIPLLAIGAAFSFVIQMFNIPVLGGTTGHAVGGVVIAILLGPWAAFAALSVVLVMQALLFGDGGLTALGANIFNMAFVAPFSGYYVYRLVSAGAGTNSRRQVAAAGVGGFVGLLAGAAATGFELGLQPLIAHTAEGQPLYAPYPLNIALPAMLLEHFLIFSWVEGVITALVIVFLQKTEPSLVAGLRFTQRVRSERMLSKGKGGR
jgi:cobalt/nickel transport system permease protein